MNCGLQQLHEAGKTSFVLQGGSIPEWLDKESRGPSISFWFRNQFPPKVLCLLITRILEDNETSELVTPVVVINGKVRFNSMEREMMVVELDHIHLFDLHVLPFRYELIQMASEKEWKHVEITYEGLFDTSLIKAMGIHVFKEESWSIEDIRYDDPYFRELG